MPAASYAGAKAPGSISRKRERFRKDSQVARRPAAARSGRDAATPAYPSSDKPRRRVIWAMRGFPSQSQ